MLVLTVLLVVAAAANNKRQAQFCFTWISVFNLHTSYCRYDCSHLTFEETEALKY